MAKETPPVIPTPNVPVFIWPTPNHEDRLFWVWRDGTLPKYDHKQWNYGDKFDNQVDFPDHQLIHVSPQSDTRWSKWYYMADRDNQDAYNWEFTDADIGGTKFPAVQRTYIFPRKGFTPSTPIMGTTMPNVPADLFQGTYVLADRKQSNRLEKEMESLYIMETRTYVQKSSMIRNDFDEALSGNLQSIQTLYYKGEIASGGGSAQSISTIVSGTVTTGATVNATLTLAGMVGSPIVVPVQAALGDTADTIAYKIALALDSNLAVYGKAFVTASSSTVTIRKRMKEAHDSTMALSVAAIAGITFTTGPASDGSLGTAAIEDYFADTENTFWGMQGDFTAREGVQLTANWFAVTQRQVVPSDFAFLGRSYNTTEDYTWPAVLGSLEVDVWGRQEGGQDSYLKPIYAKEAYRGSCAALVTERFYTSPTSVGTPSALKPLPINVQCPFFGLNIPPTLHGEFIIETSTGTDHPVYVYTVGTWTFVATTPTDWPASVIAGDTISPFRGGYIRRTSTIYKP